MTFVASERPGIYSDYEASSITYSNYGAKIVGIVAEGGTESEEVTYITRKSDAITSFGENSSLTKLCSIALENGAYKVAAVSVASVDPDYESAFELIANEDNIYAVICDSESVTVQQLLEDSVNDASENMKERIGIIGCAANADVETWADNFNNERIILVAQNPYDGSSTLSSNYLAAALAGAIAKNTDPSSSFNGMALSGVDSLYSNLSEDDIDDYIGAGITVFEYIDSKVKIIRAVTSKTTIDDTPNTTFKELNTILIIDEVIPAIRQSLSSFLPGAKNNSATRSSIATQTIIKLEEYKSLDIIDSYEEPLVYASSDDASICIVEIEFTIERGLNQINISAHIKV